MSGVLHGFNFPAKRSSGELFVDFGFYFLVSRFCGGTVVLEADLAMQGMR